MRMMVPGFFLLFFLVIFPVSGALPIPDGQNLSRDLVITQPSVNESIFAEMRDFYVYGIFPHRLQAPGDIRIELFRGDDTLGEKVRIVESHVDPATGITPWHAIEMNYSHGLDWGNMMVPDLVKEPGGLLDPSNKLVVTNEYYLGLILGGVTKNFDTSYRDREGKPLQDLTAGNYTLRVTGLSGDLAGQTAQETLTFGLTSSALSTDRPPTNLANRFQYAWNHNLRVYRDWFPGYFQFAGYDNKGYSVPGRWNPNNGIEVANDMAGTSLDKPAVAENMMIQYNINERSTTYAVEIAAMLRYGLEDSKNSTFLHYDIGEPYLAYYDTAAGTPMNRTGNLLPFSENDRLALTRAEIYPSGSPGRENTFDPNNTTAPMQVDYRVSDGIIVPRGSSFTLYGVTKPIKTTVTPTSTPYRFMLDNRIAGIGYTVTNEQGNVVYRSERDVNLSRLFTPGSGQRFNSLYEFGHTFGDLNYPGNYRISLVGTDEQGNPVSGTDEVFPVTILPSYPGRACTYNNIWTWFSTHGLVNPLVRNEQNTCPILFPRFTPRGSVISYESPGPVKRIAILSVPDIHSSVLPHRNKNGSYVGGLAQSAAVIRTVRGGYDGSLLLSSGDDMGNDDNGFFFKQFQGVPERTAMSAMGFDAGAIGNHDFDERLSAYRESLNATTFPIISANIRFDDAEVQKTVRPYIIRNVAGTRIGIFGLSYPDEDEYTPVLDGITIDPEITVVAQKMVRELKDQNTDIIIALTHLGKEKDHDLAEQVDGIDLIVGGHDHIYYLDQINKTGGRKTAMFDGGVYGESVSVYSFEYRGDGIERPSWQIIPVNGSMGRDPHISALIEPSMIRYASWSGTPAGSLDHELDAQKYDPLTGQSETGTFVTTAMRQFGSGADIAFCPTGSFNKSAFYQKGTITNGELGLMIDHNNRLSWITMSGADIKNVLETSASFMKPFPDNRTGIVTPVHPLVLQVSGITMNIDPAMDPGQRVSNVKLVTESGSTDLRPDQKYRVVVNTRIGQFDKRYGIFMEEPAGNVRNTDVRILDTVMDYTAYRNPVSDPARMPAATA